MHATNHWHQVRREQQANFVAGHLLQPRFGFGMMTMAGHAIRFEVVTGLAENQIHIGLFASA